MNDKPPVLQRLRLALDVYRYGFKRRSPAQPQNGVFIWPAWREGQPQWQIVDYGSYVNEGFNLNTLIYSAIAYKARAISLAKLRAYEGDIDSPTPLPMNHPLSKLAARPNRHQSGREFQALQTVYLNISGNAYTLLERDGRGNIVAMWPVRPDRVTIVPAAGSIMGYYYVPEGRAAKDGVPVLPDDMMHVKLPNPGDPLDGLGYGLSPLSAAARSADVDNMVTDFLNKFFKSGTMINTYITYNVPMDPDVMADVRERFQEIYGGYESWVKPGVFDNAGQVSRFGMTFDEMGFDKLDERNESRVLGPLGVPPVLIGSRIGMLHSSYANYEEARRAFWEDTMVPETELHADEYLYHLRTDDGGFVAFDYAGVPALRRNIPELVQAWRGLVEMGIPKREAARIVDLPLGELPDGDVVYMPLNMLPVTRADTQPPDAADMPDAQDDAGKLLPPLATRKDDANAARKAAQYKAVDRIAVSWEARFATAAREAFEIDRREALALLTQAKNAAYTGKKMVDWGSYSEDVTVYLDGSENWQDAFSPMFQGVMTAQMNQWAEILGQPPLAVQNLYAGEWFSRYTMVFAQEVSDTTKRDIARLAAQAQAEGWSIPTMQKRLELLFRQYMDGDVPAEDFEWLQDRMPAYRRELIARDQTLRASNAGTHELFKEWGIQQQEWLTAMDGRQRDSHAAMNGQTVPVGQPFTLPSGAQLMYPGDGSMGASLADIIQCRCVAIPLVQGEA